MKMMTFLTMKSHIYVKMFAEHLANSFSNKLEIKPIFVLKKMLGKQKEPASN